MKQEFQEQDIHASPEALLDKYNQDNKKIQDMNQLEVDFANNSNVISEMAEKENLATSVASQLPEQVNQSMQAATQKIEEKQNEFSEQKSKAQEEHEKFRSDNEVTDYGKKIDNIIKRVSQIPFDSLGLMKEKSKKTETDTKEDPE